MTFNGAACRGIRCPVVALSVRCVPRTRHLLRNDQAAEANQKVRLAVLPGTDLEARILQCQEFTCGRQALRGASEAAMEQLLRAMANPGVQLFGFSSLHA